MVSFMGCFNVTALSVNEKGTIFVYKPTKLSRLHNRLKNGSQAL